MIVKQVIVIRRDLKMRRGKEIAQGAHASMAWLTKRLREAAGDLRRIDSVNFSDVEWEWIRGIFTKIVVQVPDEAALRAVYVAARAQELIAELVVDSGLTEFAGVPTATACAIGPDEASKVDAITGNLLLY